ncbi:SixA phosphatase family protein [Luteimonas sp. RIT-PG2_3]
MRTHILITTSLLAGLACGAAMEALAQSLSTAPTSTFIVVRHAEKASDTARDPDLSAQGHARAQRLAQRMAARDIVAAYASGYRRTQQTVEPTATAHAVAITTYDAAVDAGVFAAQLQRDHANGSVLIAGHSNTVPAIVSALCQCPVPDMDDAVYDQLYEVEVGAGQPPRLRALQMP